MDNRPQAAFDLAQAVWPDVEQATRRLLVVPVGSLEQHGPHLPLDTDTRIATAVARRACAGRPGVALAACLTELGRHTSLHWAALLLVNGHGGNAAAVEAATGRLRFEGRAAHAWHAGLPGGDAHAGRSETSVMLALAPDDVRLRDAAAGRTEPVGQLMPALRERGVRAVSGNGVLGDPAGASAAEGERLLARLTAALGGTMDRLLGPAHEPG
jgi:creatinine amidohydrolase